MRKMFVSCKSYDSVSNYTKSLVLLTSVILFLLVIILRDFFLSSDIIVLKEETEVIRRQNPTLAWYTETCNNDTLFWLPTELEKFNCSKGDKIVHCNIATASQLTDKAEGYLFYATAIQSLPLPRLPETLWGLVHEESPRNKQELMHEEALNMFNFSSTFSRYSDVPMPLIWMQSIDRITSKQFFKSTSQKNTLLSELAPVLYFQSSCETSTERDAYVKKLMDYISIDSYGVCLNNKKYPGSEDLLFTPERTYLSHLDAHELYEFTSRYKFAVAIENGVCNDYLTEKFWRAIYVGVVPIYYGDPLIREWLPNNKSAILLEDFPTPELLSKHLYELLANDKKYEEYLEHKTKGLISNQRIFDEMKARPYQADFVTTVNMLYCVMCKRLHDKNSTQVNIVTKKHYNCPLPTSALTLSVNPVNKWLQLMKIGKKTVETIIKVHGMQGGSFTDQMGTDVKH